MQKLAIISADDFEKVLSEKDERSIGGISSVIKSIIYYLNFDSIYLFGITHNKECLGRSISISGSITFIPIVYIPRKDKIPARVHTIIKAWRINKYLRKYKINTIYSHSIEMSFWIKKKHLIIQHMHGAENAIRYSKFKHFRLNPIIQLWELIRKRELKKANQIIAIDEPCYQLASKYKDNKHIHILNNFVDTNIFYKDSAISTTIQQFNNEKIILFVGRIEEVKGLELFVDVVNELNNPEVHWRGVIVGKGSYESTIIKYAEKLGVKDYLHFIGAIYDQNELRKLYNQAKVLLLTSYHEGIPMTILESLACGTPVVSTDVGGISKLAYYNLQCFTFEDRNSKVFADKIREIDSFPSQETFNDLLSAQHAAQIINKILKNENS